MWTLTNNYEWANLRDSFSWIKDMEGVSQDPIHHAEGDVAIHTQMVLDALRALPDFNILSDQDQEILKAAVLLHDVEKRSTTTIDENGRITAKGHAKKGASTAQSILFQEHQTPFAIRQFIVGLVRHHGLPIWSLEKKDAVHTLLKAACWVEMPLLAMVAEADIRGRICTDQNELLDRLELFKMFCEEQECWRMAPEFPSPLARYQFLNHKSEYRHYEPFEKDAFEVVLMSGLPGMGKDTYIERNYADWPVISLDQIRKELKILPGDKKGTGKVVQLAKERAKELLRRKKSFVWNGTNLYADLRKKLIDLFQDYGARTHVVYIEVPFAQWRKQNASREAQVPTTVLERMLKKWEVPQLWEAPYVFYVVQEN